ncbi:O-acyltransferase [Macleaya cordata]|uniref:O-acyltransferase n=1 Tax=Macleaya cordata TaxID=56857 RepID=A0A200QYX2_MACCD|nr:O-acyltransferase [Macleaya cordata]
MEEEEEPVTPAGRHIVSRDIGDKDNEDEMILVNRYLEELAVSSPLDTDKPLWEVHVLRNQKLVVFRIHHALGHGISLMSLVLALCRKVDHPDQLPTIPSSSSSSSSSSSWISQNHTIIKPPRGLRITGLAMVNLRKQPGLQDLPNLMKNKSVSSWWGNNFGFVLLPIYHHRDVDDPLQYVKRAKAMVDRKKLSLEAHFSYRIGTLIMSLLGPKIATLLSYRIFCNTSFTISNVVVPQEEIMFVGNPITSFRVTSTSLPHATTPGKAQMQILVAKDIIPDPQFLAKCFEDALLELKDAATAATKN